MVKFVWTLLHLLPTYAQCEASLFTDLQTETDGLFRVVRGGSHPIHAECVSIHPDAPLSLMVIPLRGASAGRYAQPRISFSRFQFLQRGDSITRAIHTQTPTGKKHRQGEQR
jgi:hypothetical protein